MTIHKSDLGTFGEHLPSDLSGYVPTIDTTAWELNYDHGTEQTHDTEGNLTDYGRWWEHERFPEIRAEAITATETAEAEASRWRSEQT